MNIDVFPRRTLRGRRWYFHGQDDENGEILFHGEGYWNLDDAMSTVGKIQREVPGAAVHIHDKGKRI